MTDDAELTARLHVLSGKIAAYTEVAEMVSRIAADMNNLDEARAFKTLMATLKAAEREILRESEELKSAVIPGQNFSAH